MSPRAGLAGSSAASAHRGAFRSPRQQYRADVPATLRVSEEWFSAQLRDALARAHSMREMATTTEADRVGLLAAFRSWDERNKRLLEQAFTPTAWHESSPKSDYSTLQGLKYQLIEDLPEDEAPGLLRLIEEKARLLESLLDSVDLFVVAPDAQTAASGEDGATIFLVHGRDPGAREEVRRYLERVTQLPVVILADQASRGQTIIEKLEAHVPDSAYVVVLMTADDEGRLRGEDSLNLRARQNVVFELGMAVGRLGRRNVVVLYEDGVELPSDYYGVGYVAFDAGGGWKLGLIAEIKAAGISADANRAID